MKFAFVSVVVKVVAFAVVAVAGVVGAGVVGADPTGIHAWQMHRVTFTDQTASQQNLVAGSMLLPPGWSVRAGGNYKSDCVFSPARLELFIESGDGSVGIHVVPALVQAWSDNPQTVQMYRTSYAEFAKARDCKVHPPVPVDAALREGLDLLKVRAAGQPQPVPGLGEELRDNVKKVNAQLAQVPGAGSISADAGRIRFTGMLNNKNVEGWLIFESSIRTMPAPGGGGSTFLMDSPLIAILYAPPGQLDANEKMMNAMLGTIQLDPNWVRYTQQATQQIQQIIAQAYQRVANIHAQMMQDNLRTQQKIAAIRADTQNYANKVYSNVASNRAAALHSSAQQFSLYMGDEAIYKNPSNGERVQMSSAYGHAWASTTGNGSDYLLTDSPSYDPNGKVGSGGWTELQQER